jgi:protein-tyrosine-phosphatase
MGEAILKRRISELPDAIQWHVESAGTWAIYGSGPAALSKYVMELMGMDISAHRSQPIDLELLQNFNLILTMEDEHKRWLQDQFSDFANRTFLLSEMIGQYMDIHDPIGGELSDYEETARLMDQIITQGFNRICELALINERS